MVLATVQRPEEGSSAFVSSVFASRFVQGSIPRLAFLTKSIALYVLVQLNSCCLCVIWYTILFKVFRYQMPEKTIPKEAAYEIIHDELLLDCNPRLNLASFVTTWMEPECDKLVMESMNKNYADKDEYPATTELQASKTCSPYLIFPFISTKNEDYPCNISFKIQN